MKKTLKTMLFVAMMVIVLVCLTGCANINYEIKLNKDGSGDVSYVIGYDKAFLTSMGVKQSDLANNDKLEEMKKKAQQDGYTVETYEDDATFGFKANKAVKNIQEEFSVKNTIGTGSEENEEINFEKSLLKTKYSQNAKMDLSIPQSGTSQENAMVYAIMGQMKISYKITLPFKVGENNATTVSEDGKTLEWKMQYGKVNEIKFQAEEDYTMIALAGLAVLLLIVVVIIIIALRKKGNITKVEPTKEEVVKETKPEPVTEPVVEEVVTQEAPTEEVVENQEEPVEEIVNDEEDKKEE